VAHPRRLIGAAALYLHIVRDVGVGIEPAVADGDAGQHPGDRLGDRIDDMRPLGLGMRRQPFVEHDAAAHHDETVGMRLPEMLERCHAATAGLHGRQAGDQAWFGHQVFGCAGRRDFGDRHQFRHVLE
jgi:hypothetical protein